MRDWLSNILNIAIPEPTSNQGSVSFNCFAFHPAPLHPSHPIRPILILRSCEEAGPGVRLLVGVADA